MVMVAKNALGLMVFGGVRLAHGVGDGFAYLFLGILGVGVSAWGIMRALRSGTSKH